jgi:Ca2+-binding EF-hand superfamily protein
MEGKNNNYLIFIRKFSGSIQKGDISKAFEDSGLDVTDKEINEMISMITGTDKVDDITIHKEDFKKFYIEK